MKKRNIPFIVVLSLLLFISLGIYLMGYYAKRPIYEARYFTQPYLVKYSSPEAAFNHLWESHILADKEYYQEVLGRKLSERESKWTKSSSEKPEIERVTRRKNSAYILAKNNWGGSFEMLNGRWVFQNKEFGLFCRNFFRILNLELSRFQ